MGMRELFLSFDFLMVMVFGFRGYEWIMCAYLLDVATKLFSAPKQKNVQRMSQFNWPTIAYDAWDFAQFNLFEPDLNQRSDNPHFLNKCVT